MPLGIDMVEGEEARTGGEGVFSGTLTSAVKLHVRSSLSRMPPGGDPSGKWFDDQRVGGHSDRLLPNDPATLQPLGGSGSFGGRVRTIMRIHAATLHHNGAYAQY